MNQNKLLKKLSFLLVLLTFTAGSVFAQTYVSVTNGDDAVGDGSMGAPYKTIAVGMTNTVAGGSVIVEPGDYAAAVTVTKALTITAVDFGVTGAPSVIITNLTLNMTTGTDVLSLGQTGLPFNIDNLTLTDGVMNIATANVVVSTGSMITRTEGSLNMNPTTTNVDVDYNGASSQTAGGELPGDLGTGALTVNIGAANTLTIGSALIANGVTITTGDVSFTDLESDAVVDVQDGNTTVSGTLTLNDVEVQNNGDNLVTLNDVTFDLTGALADAVDNASTGNLTINGTLTFNNDDATYNADINNQGTGTLTVANPISTPDGDPTAGTNFVEVDAINGSTGDLVLGGGTVLTITNTSGGTVELLGDLTVEGTGAVAIDNADAASVIQLNANTMTVNGAAPTLDNSGGGLVISAAAATAGSGIILVDDGVLTVDDGEVPNVQTTDDGEFATAAAAVDVWGNVTNAGTATIGIATVVNGNVTSTGAVDLNAALDITGNYTQNTGGTLDFNAQTMTLEGNWFRDSNVLADVTQGTGTLALTGANDATITPGAQLSLYNVTVNKDALADMVTLAATIIVDNDLTITQGTVELSDFHIRLETAGGTFDNGSGGYQTTGIGFVIVDHAGATTFTGAGTFSNLDIRSGATVNMASDINFSGVLNVRNGTLDFNDGVADGNDFDLTLTDAVRTVPQVNLYTVAGEIGDQSVTPSGVMDVATDVEYDLTYLETLSTTGEEEWIAAGIRNLSVNTTGGATITSPAIDSEITGILTVEGTEELDLAGQDLTLSGGQISHFVLGTVTTGAGALVAEGDASSINGSADDADARTIEDLTVNVATGETFTVANIHELSGNLLVNDGTSSVSLINDPTNDLDGQLAGDVTVVDGQLTLSIAPDGDDATAEEIGGNVLINDGTLVTGGDFTVVGTTDLGAGALETGTIQVNTNNLTLGDVFTHNGTGSITGTGTVIVDYAGAGNFVLTTDLSISNLEINTGANAVDVTSGDLTVTDSYTHTSGDFDINARSLTVSGDSFSYVAGSLLATGGAGVVSLTGGDVTLSMEAGLTLVNLTTDVTTLTLVDAQTVPTGLALTISDDLTQTAGNFALGINDLIVQTDFTRTAGSYSMTTGTFEFNSAGTIDQGTGWAVDNLVVSGGTATMADKAFTITESLVLASTLDANSNFGTSPPLNLTFGDGVTIERQDDAATLAEDANYQNTVNLSYTTDAGGITSSDEVPTGASVLNDVNVEIALTLARDLQINGTLTVSGNVVAGAQEIAMAANSSVVLVDKASGTAFDEALVPAGVLNVKYTNTGGADIATHDEEVGTAGSPFSIGTFEVDGTTNNIDLHRDLTVTNLAISDGGNLDLIAFDLDVTADVTFSDDGLVVNSGAAANLNLSGATDGTMDLNADWAPVFEVNVDLNKTNENDEVTLTGADLDFANNDLVLTRGLFNTDATSKIILTQGVSGGQPTQGYTRTDGVIRGNVEKFIDRTAAVDISTVIFPTGSNSNFRPAVFYFKTAPGSSINLMVNHEEESPNGSNGIPITLPGQSITNYPDFYWFVKSDVALAPSYQYDLELQAEGYSDYTLDGIQNVRMIRRDSGNVANPWVLQGDDGNYDNSTIAADHPLVKVIDATGGITGQGSRFTYSQSNKAPVIDKTAEVNSVPAPIVADAITIAEDVDTLVVSYTASDPDVGDTPTLASESLPLGAVYAAGVVTWTPDFGQVGANEIIIKATDTYAAVTYDTLTVTVTKTNRPPVYTAAPADTVQLSENVPYMFTYVATDPDGDDVTYSYIATGSVIDSISLNATSGLLTIKPQFGDKDSVFTLTVTADDGDAGTVDTMNTFVVNKFNRAPVVDTPMPDTTVAENSMLTLDFGPNFSDPDGDAITFTHKLLLGAAVVDSADHGAMTAAGVYTWTPDFTQAGTYVLVATGADLTLSADDSVTVVVTPTNSPPQWAAGGELPDTTVFLGNDLMFTYVAEDLDLDAIAYAFNGTGPPGATIDPVSGELAWTPAQTFPAVIRVMAIAGTDTIYTQAVVDIEVVTVTVSGNVTYNRSSGAIPIAGATVNLMDGAAVVATDVTDAAGAYSFADVSAGSYTLMTTKTTEWGGSLASDALEVALYEVNPAGPHLPDTLSWTAGWVTTLFTGPSSADALSILNRSVNKTTSYTIADWQFFDQDVEVATEAVVMNFEGICAGDARSDYDPNAAMAKSLLTMNIDEVQKIQKNSAFDTAIKLVNAAKVGSFTMQFRFPADKVEVTDVKVGSGSLAYKVENDVLSIAWADLTGKNALNVEDGGAIAMVSFKASEKFAKAEEVTFEMVKGEVTDGLAKSFAASVSVATITVGVPDVYDLSQNYPNPFNPSTTIQYDLPENGKVNLAIYNTLGEQIANLVDTRQEAGSYEVRWNASNLATGVYFYRLHVEGVKGFVLTKKMILMK